MAKQRLSVYDAELEFARSVEVRDIGFFALMQGVLADRSFVLTSGMDPSDLIPLGSGRHRPSLRYYRFSGDGAALDSLGPFPGDEIEVTVGDGSFSFSTSTPFGRSSYLVPAGEAFYFVDSGLPEIQILDRESALAGLIRVPHEPRAIGDAEIETLAAYTVDGIDDGDEREARRRQLLELTYPPTMPAFEAALLDSQDHLWLQEYRWPRDATPTWLVLDREGRLLGRVRTPDGLHIRDIGDDYVLGVASDEFDVEQVRIHALSRGDRD